MSKFLTTKEYSARTGLSERYLRQLWHCGALPALLVGEAGRGRQRLLFDVDRCDLVISSLIDAQTQQRRESASAS